MADAVILATARASDATLWTQDADFAAVPDVRYVAKPNA
jgi:predicted nucleic acid-binding protein